MNNSLSQKLHTFFSRYKHQQYKKGEMLIRSDEVPCGVFYLQEGFVKQYTISQKGEELVLNIFKPVAFFPMSWAINETPNNYFFEAMSDVSVWLAPKEDVLMFLKTNPDVLFNLMSRVYKGIDGVLTRMVYLMTGNAYSRLITELIIYAKRFGKGEDTIKITIPEKDIAAQSGMTRETVSREMKKLKDKGLIRFEENTFIITDLKKLEIELSDNVYV